MLESKSISESDEPSNVFDGIRFILVGFDSVGEHKVRSKLLERGAVDALDYGPDCNCVVVDNVVYDDPICVAARRDDKILVTGLWVDYSFGMDMPVDPNYIMYRPVRDLDGIPGAKSLVMCLTGYQRHDRDHIMTMVSLMGAKFSKPLVANKVTHLICYKFEGEKYEVGKKLAMIKLVNHRWLEDCLKAWELLPEANYAKSGYELEMEAEVKDSEDETEDMASTDPKKSIIISPQNTRVESKNVHQSPKWHLTEFGSTANNANASKVQPTLRQEAYYGDKSFSRETHDGRPDMSNTPDRTLISENTEQALASASGNAKKSVDGGVSKLSSKSMKANLPLRSERFESNSGSPSSKVSKLGPDEGLDILSGRTPLRMQPKEQTAGLSSKKKPSIPRSPALSHSPKTLMRSGLATKPAETPVSRSSIDGSRRLAFDVSPTGCLREEVSDVFVDQDGIQTGGIKSPLKGPLLYPDEEQTGSSPGKKTMSVSRGRSTKLSYSRKRVTGTGSDTKPMGMQVSGSSVYDSPELAADIPPTTSLGEELSGAFGMQSEKVQSRTDSGEVKSPLKGVTMHLNEEETTSLPSKKKMSSKSKRLSHSPKKLVGSGLVTKAPETPVSGSSTHALKQSAVDVSPPANTTSPLTEEVPLPSKEALPISTLQEDDRQELTKQTLKRSRGRPKKHRSPNLEVKEPSLGRTKSCTVGEEMHQDDQQGIEPQFPSTSSRVEKLDGEADLNSSKLGDNSGTKSKVPKKLGSRPAIRSKLGDNSGTKSKVPKILGSRPAIRKGLISAGLINQLTSHSNGAIAIKETDNVSLADKSVVVPRSTKEDASLGDHTEAPTCEGPNEFLNMEDNNSAEVEEPHSGKRKQPSGKTTQVQKRPKSKAKQSNEAKSSVSSAKTELPESKSAGDAAEKKVTKRPLAKSKTNKLKDDKTVSCNEENVALAGKASKRASKKLKGSDDVEKENEPLTNGKQTASHDAGAAAESQKNGCKTDKANTEVLNTKAEPAWFILSGHKLQRKEFQQVIKRLKGRVCRDTHNWSYQATHFIVPDPIRRTEKFFAAAASGSWILKTDYLSASNEAGRFLSEEPFEWHKKLLTEDGAISLEAPRKWRQVKERTGHGAFFGMLIIIYGECIAPPLDTLKRAVKAGDGTILATSPPYTRFLNSKVDFAIVSPGMPRVDMWVQEFLGHEIPCVSADYLVEYVCKPGYSLERHVMYNTHAWAERSLQSLVKRVEEADEDPKTRGDDGDESGGFETRKIRSRSLKKRARKSKKS